MSFRRIGGGAGITWIVLLTVGARCLSAEPPEAPPKLRLNHLRAEKVLFLGNSIAKHDPAPEIGWTGDWGMAASAEDKDFVHQLVAKLEEATHGKPQWMVQNIADFERQYVTYDLASGLKSALEFDPDLVIVAIGENVPALSTREARDEYRVAFRRLLELLRRRGQPAIFVRSTFWVDPTKDEIMAQGCRDLDQVFVDLGGLDRDERNFARSERKFQHDGVAAHPGDAGMRAIAQVLWKAVDETSRIEPQKPTDP